MRFHVGGARRPIGRTVAGLGRGGLIELFGHGIEPACPIAATNTLTIRIGLIDLVERQSRADLSIVLRVTDGASTEPTEQGIHGIPGLDPRALAPRPERDGRSDSGTRVASLGTRASHSLADESARRDRPDGRHCAADAHSRRSGRGGALQRRLRSFSRRAASGLAGHGAQYRPTRNGRSLSCPRDGDS